MSNRNGMNRRSFLKSSTLGLAGAGVLGVPGITGAEEKKEQKEEAGGFKIKKFRTLGRTGFKASDISSGGPMNEGILNALLDAGVNYIDTAENYGNGLSETVTGKMIKDRDRKSLFITSKMAVKKDDTKESLLARARKSLERLQTTHIDCMMIHSPAKVADLASEPFHAAMKQLKAEGKVRFVGVSNHGTQWRDTSDPMVNMCLAAAADGRFDLMLFVYNFIQKDVGEKIIAACKEKNIGVSLMKTNPVGAYLDFKAQKEQLEKEGKKVPGIIDKLLPRFKIKADKAEGYVKAHNLNTPQEIRDASIKFVLQHPGVHTVCCSFQSFDDLDKYLKLSGTPMTPQEGKKLAAYKEGVSQFYCRHACGICESDCPHNVPVNTIMRYNHYFEAQGREKHAMQKYAAMNATKPEACLTCSGHCNEACPYGVPVQGLLTLAHRRLSLV